MQVKNGPVVCKLFVSLETLVISSNFLLTACPYDQG
jgi:hypothetical protein